MKTLHNPTDNTIEVQIFGVKYVVEPRGTVSVPEDVAKYWVHNLHSFMQVVADAKSVDVVEPVAEVVEETNEVVAEEDVAEETVTEKVKRVVKRATKK